MGITALCLRRMKMFVIPHPDNHDRPLALRHRPLALVSTLLLVIKIATVGVVALMPQSAELSTITAARVVQLINAERKGAGLREFAVNDALSQAAAQKAQHMLDEDYFAHISPSGVTPWFWMNKIGYHYQVAGENLAIDFTEVEDVVQAWMASPNHRDNILHPSYVETGVAVLTGEFQGGTSTVVVHMFGLPTAGHVNAQTDTSVTTPAAEPTPATSPLPTTVPVQPSPALQAPPPVPRIALRDSVILLRDTASLVISGKPHTTVYLLANKKSKGAVKLNAQGLNEYSISIADLPDGTVLLQAYSRDTASNQSDLSDVLAVTKDTQGPLLARQQVSFILSPATDSPYALLQVAADDYVAVAVTNNGQVLALASDRSLPFAIPALDAPLNIALRDAAGNTAELKDVKLYPDFFTERTPEHVTSAASISQFARRVIAGVFSVVLVLLTLAIMLRIRIQHPDLIIHTSLVLLLAATLFFL